MAILKLLNLKRFRVIDGTKSIEEINEMIINEINILEGVNK